MPTYRYVCDNCKHELEQHEGFHDKRKVKCPVCLKYKLYVDCSGVMGAIYQEPKTLGHQASRNTEKMGTSERSEKQEVLANTHTKVKKKPRPWWRSTDKIDKSIGKMTDKQKQKYIATGEKP